MDWIKQHKWYLVAILFLFTYFLYTELPVFTSTDEKKAISFDEQNIVVEKKQDEIKSPAPSLKWMADIKGAVLHPGVYEITQDSRVVDLIDQAGGLTEDADTKNVNFAMRIKDEMVIYIPKRGEKQDDLGQARGATLEEKERKIDLNQAESSDLEDLPGIGPSKAKAILDYRQEKGSFSSIEEIKEISGIGEKTFEKLKEHIYVQ